MPHVCFVPFTGFRVSQEELRALGMTLPGFQQRGKALAELPALGLLTLAGMTPEPWTCSYRGAAAVNTCFIVGAEGETRDSLDRLTEFLLASDFAEVQVAVQTPFPGTGLYERLRRAGRLLSNRGWPYYTLFDVTYRPDAMSVEELEIGYRNVLRQVYSREATARRELIRREVWRRARERRRS